MATIGSFSYETGKYTFTITYSYTNTSFKVTGIKTKCKEGGWAAWELTPSLHIYILKGKDPVKKSWQLEYSGSTADKHIKDHGGTHHNYHGNSPSNYLSNRTGGVVTWKSTFVDKLNSISLSGSKVTLTIGSYIINTTGTLSNVAYGYKTITLSLYTKPSDLKLSVHSKTDTTITPKATWKNGSEKSKAILKIGTTSKTIYTSGNTVTFKNLKGNTKYAISGYLKDSQGTHDPKTIYSTTKLSPVTSLTVSEVTTTTITVKASSSNTTTTNKLGYQYRYKLKSATSYSTWSSTIPHGTSYTIKNLKQNNLYMIQARVVRTIDGELQQNTKYYSVERWTRPVAKLSLELLKGSEHNTIVATAGAVGSNQFAKYIFRIDSNGFDNNDYNKDIPNPMKFTNLPGHTTHTIAVKMKNTVSGLESAEVSGTIETWYDPIYSLSVDLVNNWYWFLSIKALFNYQGGPENIKSYEFGIFKDQNNNVLTNTGKTNSYSKGSTTPGQSDNLDYNTNYNCIIRLTDNYDRTYTANRVFKTLDARPLYLNGKLQELRLIKPGNITDFITPNLLNVNLPDGKSINMNLMINGDPRTEFE